MKGERNYIKEHGDKARDVVKNYKALSKVLKKETGESRYTSLSGKEYIGSQKDIVRKLKKENSKNFTKNF